VRQGAVQATSWPPSFEALLNRPGIAWMGQNTTHLRPPSEVVEALLKSTREREFQLYAPALGFEELRQLIVEDLNLTGVEAMVTDGAASGLHHICTALAPSISRLITSNPGWPWPAKFVGLEGIPTSAVEIYSPKCSFKLLAEQIEEVIEERSLIYLIDPLNPLGSVYERDELQAIVDLARGTGSLLIHDCTYRHFARRHTPAAELFPEGTFTTYSFSKWLGLAGLRVGAVVAEPELLGPLAQVPSDPLGANIQGQRAAIAGLKNKRAWLERLLDVNVANQEIVISAIRSSGIGEIVVEPSHGNFVAADISESGLAAEAVCDALLEDEVFIRPGTYQSRAFGQRFVKISTSVPTEWAERFAAAWSNLPSQAQRP
jgi:histidinol-phosphate aminotransferase